MNQELLEELRVLLALGELTEEEESFLQASLDDEEQAALYNTINTVAYATPILPLPAHLKAKIFHKIAIESQPFVPTRFQELTWEPHPVVAGVHLAKLHIDPTRREVSCLVRCEPKVRFPLHLHQGVEEILILEGEIVIGAETYYKGDFLLSRPNSSHAPETPQGCLFYVHTSLDDRFVEWSPGMIWRLLTGTFRRQK